MNLSFDLDYNYRSSYPEVVSTLHSVLENGADLHVNKHQKIRHNRARSTEERRRRRIIEPVDSMSIIDRGVGKGGAGGAAAPPLFEKGGIAPSTFFARDDNFLSTAMPLHTSVYRTNGNI